MESNQRSLRTVYGDGDRELRTMSKLKLINDIEEAEDYGYMATAMLQAIEEECPTLYPLLSILLEEEDKGYQNVNRICRQYIREYRKETRIKNIS